MSKFGLNAVLNDAISWYIMMIILVDSIIESFGDFKRMRFDIKSNCVKFRGGLDQLLVCFNVDVLTRVMYNLGVIG